MVPTVGVTPRLVDQFPIFLEASAVVAAYAPLRARDSGAPVPGIGPPFGLAPRGVVYHHSTISAHAVVERISTGVGCPVVSAQPPGTSLCSIVYTYANAVVAINISKR